MKKILSFLSSLRENNEKEWFYAHKDQYQAAMAEFGELVEQLIAGIGEFDTDITDISPQDCLFRIYNDRRFAKNKPPYKGYLGAWIVKGGKKAGNDKAGYYLQIEPGRSFVGGGIYHPSAPELHKIRKYVEHNAKELKSILRENEFKKFYPALWDEEKLSRPPAGFDKDYPDIELLKYKSYVVMHTLPDEALLSGELVPHLIKAFKAQYRFSRFLNTAAEQRQ